ncbi:MAG: phosphatidylserine decarboxylase [Cyanobacteriota bacterium]
MKKIFLYNRKTKKIEEEIITGKLLIKLIYNNKIGLKLTEKILKKPKFSFWYGNLLKTKRSKNKINSFIKQHSLDINEIEDRLDSFKSFNDFFIRKLKKTSREIDHDKTAFISPADSRLIVYKIEKNTIIPVKGINFKLEQIINNKKIAEKYEDGLCFVFRLAPADYHRFCYIDDGIHGKIKSLGSYYHSVHPIALQSNSEVFQHNYREFCEIQTKNFDEILWLDVGALGVSKIIQNKPLGGEIKKGEEKGYFEFGGSTIIIVTKKNIIKLDDDIKDYSFAGIETKIKYGEKIGTMDYPQ